MDFSRVFSLCLCFLFCLSCVSGVSAVSAEKCGEDINDFAHYTIASKIVYVNAWHSLRTDVGLVPDGMHTLKDVASYFNSKSADSAGVVNVTTDYLKPGDIVHVKNSDYAFMIYCGQDNNDNVVLESLYNTYICPSDVFNQLFTGCAVKFASDAKDLQAIDKYRIDGGNINDTVIRDSSLPVPGYAGVSYYVNYWNNHQFQPGSGKNKQVKALSLNITAGTTNETAKAQAIFDWVQNNIKYDGNDIGSQNYAIETLRDKSGNSCDQARFVYALAKFAGLDAVFHKALCQFPNGQFAHVWVDIKADGQWLSADTTSKHNTLGKTKYSTITTDYGQFDQLDC